MAADGYSWTAVTEVFQRFFADGVGPAIQAIIKRADENAAWLVGFLHVGWDGVGHDHIRRLHGS